jgi:uncharacterized protein involved in exopolysaccharide biosynthesis
MIFAATVSCLVGALIVLLILPPRWEAKARVMLNLLKPDAVTGMVIGGPGARTYVATQIELIKDYSVAGQVADQLGWMSDPQLIEAYQKRSKNDQRDFRRWLAQLVIDGTKVEVVEGSNILEITFTGTSPQQAKSVADALRKAYLDASLAFRQSAAERDAEWYGAQSEKARALLDAAEQAKTKYERDNNIVLQDDHTDIDSVRLRALAGEATAGGGPLVGPGVTGPSASSIQLAQTDAQIAEMSKILGPNHPDLQAMRARRAALASVVAAEQRGSSKLQAGAATSAAQAGLGALNHAIEAQKATVIAKRDKVERLNQLQSEVDRRREQFNKTAQRAAELRQEAAVADTGLSALGPAVTPKDPSFPNKLLVIGGGLALGLAIGALVALLAELFGRRIRGAEELESAVDLPLLAVVPASASAKPRPGSIIGLPQIRLPHRGKAFQS